MAALATPSVPSYRLKAASFTVPGTKPGTTYRVTMETEPSGITGRAVACDCPDHVYRHRTCKHMRAAEAGTAGKIRLRIGPATTPNFYDPAAVLAAEASRRAAYAAAGARSVASVADLYAG